MKLYDQVKPLHQLRHRQTDGLLAIAQARSESILR